MPGHGLETGDVISIVGSGTTPTLDGLQTVTVVDPFTFTVPVNVTATSSDANVAGVFARQYTEYYSGNGTKYLRLNQVPVQSIANLWFDLGGYYGDPSDGLRLEHPLDRRDRLRPGSRQQRGQRLLALGPGRAD